MESVGDACDNAMCESFFATLECELLDRREFQTKAEARMAVFQFIEDGTIPAGATRPAATSPPSTTKGAPVNGASFRTRLERCSGLHSA